MRKVLLFLFLGISCFGLFLLFSERQPAIRVNVSPAVLYIDGKAVTSTVPSTLEYQGTLYVPLRLVGQHLEKQAGWEKSDKIAWLGQNPQPAAPALAAVDQTKKPAASEVPVKPIVKPDKPTLFGLSLGDTEQQVQTKLGKPARREPSPLGYEWLIYNQNHQRYLQVGVKSGKVVDLYSNAPAAQIGDVSIGTSFQSLTRKHEVKRLVSFSYKGAQVQITNLPNERLLVLNEGIPHIFYIDKNNNNKVTAVRMIDTLALLQGGYYETKWTYTGDAPNFDPPKLTIKQREAINAAHERQILDLVNVVRYRYKLPLLTWNNDAATVARNHSRDMENNNYFDHVSPTTGYDPFERLKQAGISYRSAGENIAAGYPDAIEAYESWMNSPGHRKNILEKGFSQLGVGVFVDYYTQNFVTLP